MSKTPTKLNFDDSFFEDSHMSAIYDWIENQYNDFQLSSNFKDLNIREQENTNFILRVFFDYCYSYFLVSPDQIKNSMIEEIMLDIFPRKVSADKETFIDFERVMISFLLWCQEHDYINNVAQICNTIKRLSPKMIERSQDESSWGIAKSLFHELSPDIDLDNLDSLNGIYNLPIRRYSPKIGRNDLCTCGSGKKYKKCCGVH